MIEVGAALAAGGAVVVALLVVMLPTPSIGNHAAWSWIQRLTVSEEAFAATAAHPWLDGRRLMVLQGSAAVLGLLAGLAISDLWAMGVVGAIGGIGAIRGAVALRASQVRTGREDAVLEVVRMMRQLLETGAVGVQQALAVVADSGPILIRHEFTAVAAATAGAQRKQAWARARERMDDPLFDFLSAAVEVQRPGGGEIGPVFAGLEQAVTAAYEVEREAGAMQVQARSAALLIIALPIGFLTAMSAMRSPYLEPYHSPAGEVFLVAMLAVMACSYVWIRRLLRLPQPPRLRIQ